MIVFPLSSRWPQKPISLQKQTLKLRCYPSFCRQVTPWTIPEPTRGKTCHGRHAISDKCYCAVTDQSRPHHYSYYRLHGRTHVHYVTKQRCTADTMTVYIACLYSSLAQRLAPVPGRSQHSCFSGHRR